MLVMSMAQSGWPSKAPVPSRTAPILPFRHERRQENHLNEQP
jgi:hypothetical protein